MEKDKQHYIVTTGIIIKDDKFLIAKRSEEESAFPGLWSVPGGKLEKQDYTDRPKDTSDHWYNVLRSNLRREILEEVGLEVKNIKFLTGLTYIRSDDYPTLIISLYCDYKSGDINLSEEFSDYKWVTENQLNNFEFVPGLKEEIEMVAADRRGEDIETWSGKHDDPSEESLRNGK